MLEIAHAADYLVTGAYLTPVAGFILWLLVSRLREWRRSRRG